MSHLNHLSLNFSISKIEIAPVISEGSGENQKQAGTEKVLSKWKLTSLPDARTVLIFKINMPHPKTVLKEFQRQCQSEGQVTVYEFSPVL